MAEDSATVRELLVGILESDPEIAVVGQARTGLEAVELARTLRPDLITMDVHMPVMDGFEATTEIMISAPTPIIIVSSSSSRAEIQHSLNAMRAGALMLLPKPESPLAESFDGRRAHLLAMVKAMAEVKVVRRWGRREARARAASQLWSPARIARARLIAVAASTGGPVALQRILAALPRDFPAPIVAVQHIAAGFVGGLAHWLDASTPLHVKVAEQREPLAAGTVLLAPDGRHCGVCGEGCVILTEAPPIRGHRPSATHLFETAARAFGGSTVAVVLTGMGQDGVEGLAAIRAAGGRVLAQDEATAVVYGMPREAVASGVVDEVLSLDHFAERLAELVTGGSDVGPNPDR